LIPLAEAIAQRTGRPEGEVMGVLVEATSARDDAAPPSSFRAVPKPTTGLRSPRGTKSDAEADLALMRALMSFLSATGSNKSRSTSPPTHPASPPNPRPSPSTDPTNPRVR
jgi:hypothetical protein